MNIMEVLTALSQKRPVFHSEADFQHALAWELHERGYEIRLEYRPSSMSEKAYVDIWAFDDSDIVAVELKYKTRKLQLEVGGELFRLLNQSAQDIGRYDFFKDVQRLERIVSAREAMLGYSILLTNDSSYWKQPRNENTVDSCFRLQEGRTLTGSLAWADHASEGTTKNRKQAISIHGRYSLSWRDYSDPSQSSYGRFRYLLVKIDKQIANVDGER